MAAFNFPNSPSTNDVHTENGVSWKWNGTVWKKVASPDTIAKADSKVQVVDAGTGGYITAETDGTQRLRVQNSGAIVTGILTATSFVGDGSGLTGVASTEFVHAQTLAVAGVSTFVGDTTWDSSAGTAYDMQWTTANGQLRIKDSGKLVFGSSGDVSVYHDDSNFTLWNTKGNSYIQNTGDVYIRTNNTETSIKAIANGAVELYHDGDRQVFTIDGGMNWQDNKKAEFGNSGDLKIYHDGSHSLLTNSTGYLRLLAGGSGVSIGNGDNSEAMAYFLKDGAVDLYHNNVKKFETTNLGISVTGQIHATSTVKVGDSVEFIAGDGNDLKLYHNSTDSYITNATGDLWIQGNGDDIHMRAADDINIFTQTSDKAIVCIGDGGVELYHNDVKKLATTSGGIEVQDRVYVTGAEGAEAKVIFQADEGDDNADTWKIEADTSGSLNISNFAGGSYERNIACAGNGNVELFHNNVKKFETASSGVQVTGSEWISEGTVYLEKGGAHHHRILINDQGNDLALQQSSDSGANTNFTSYLRMKDGGDIWLPVDGKKLLFGAGNDLQIYHSGSHSFIVDSGTGMLSIDGSQINFHNAAGSETMLSAVSDGSVSLYYDNSKKFETTSGGIDVTGGINLTGEFNMTGNGAKYLDFFTLANSNSITFRHHNPSGNAFETAAYFVANGGAFLTHNGVTRLSTTSSGASVSGPLNAAGATFGDYIVETNRTSGSSKGFYAKRGGVTCSVLSNHGTGPEGKMELYNNGTLNYSAHGTAGTLAINGYIRFGISNGSANQLDDYEEGSWTPTITGLGNHSTNTSATWGKYQKVGNTVTIHWKYQWTGRSTTNGGSVYLQSLPFTCNNNQRGTVCISGIEGVESNSGRVHYGGLVVLNTSTILFRASGHDVSENSLYGNNGTSMSSGYIYGHAIYEV